MSLRIVLSEGFRAFFLLAGVFAVVSIGVWVVFLLTGAETVLPVAVTPQVWHAHELVFGYGAAALAGFLLTAVPNWTGGKGAGGWFIALAAGLWLAGRVAMWLGGMLPAGMVAAVDLAFVPLMWMQVLVQLVRRPKPQQMIFLAMLALFWAGNVVAHLEWLGLGGDAWAGVRAGLLTLCAMIMVLGGRVTPGFTKNAMVQAGRVEGLPQNPAPLAVVAIAAAMLVPVAYLLGLPERVVAVPAVVAGAAGLVRVALWRGWWTRGKPILWTLHLSYAVNGAGLVLLGLAGFGIGTELGALHVLGIGAVGGMTLSVMSRATLGHGGRALVAPKGVAVAYALIPLAALVRLVAAEEAGLHDAAVLLAGGMWIVAFGLYVAAMWEVWWNPRPKRAPVGRPPE